MSTNRSHGFIGTEGETRAARFERTLGAAPAVVWEALTAPHALGAWLTVAAIEPRVGGTATFDFGEHGYCTGTVTAWVPEQELAYGWRFPDGTDSHVHWTLSPAGERCTRLVLVHSLLPADRAGGYGAGWHAYLDRLEARLAGEPPPDWSERFAALLPAYEEAGARSA